jgi:hypothetical protein
MIAAQRSEVSRAFAKLRRRETKSRRRLAAERCRRKELLMRKIFKILLAPAALAVLAGAGIATTPAKADIVVNPIFPFIHLTPPGYTYGPPAAYYYRPNCYFDAYYGRVCY